MFQQSRSSEQDENYYHVVWSLQKSANPDTSAYAGAYGDMTVEAMDDYTVKITLEKPVSPVLFFPNVADYAGGFIVCKKSYEAVGDDAFKTHPIGTGPFVFDSYSPQEKILLVANDAYFRGRPLLDGVEYRFMPDINSRELGLKSGELDAINGAAEGIWVERMNQEPGLRVDVYGVGEVATVHFDITVPPLDNPLVRKAMAYALDRDEFLALFGEPVAANVYSQVPAQFLAGGASSGDRGKLHFRVLMQPPRHLDASITSNIDNADPGLAHITRALFCLILVFLKV